VSAVGKVVELDAEGLDLLAENAKYPGLVAITLTCTLSQSREWAGLFGENVRAEQLLAVAEPEAPDQAHLPGVEP
jgi:hypothetical protein